MRRAINFSYSLISRICETALVLRVQRWGVDMQRTLTVKLFFPHIKVQKQIHIKGKE